MPNRVPESDDNQLTRSRQEFRDFISVGTHDLREPLRAIGINSDLLAGILGEEADPRAQACLEKIHQGVDRLDALLRDIADYAHGEGRELTLKETSMDAVLDEAQRQASGDLKVHQAVLTRDSLPTVNGDFFALAVVLRNLFANACRFRTEEVPRIHVGSLREGLEWRFSVRDNGIGFKPAYAETVFLPFKKLHGRQYPGSGLGLPVAKRIVEQHGGRIWADSSPGQGSTFWFSLPSDV